MRVFAVIVLLLPWFALADGEYKGWYWYEDKVKQDKEKPEKPSAKLAAQREQYDEALAAAVTDPTPDNIRAYMMISKHINDQAGDFAKAFKEVIRVSPALDRSMTARPSDSQSLMVYQQQEQREKSKALKSIASKNGIVYFFRSDCPYCETFSPMLKRFAHTFGFTVIPITLDGQGSKSYPNPKTNSPLASQMKVSAVPATFLVQPSTNKVTPIAYGLNDWSTFGRNLIQASLKLTPQEKRSTP